MTTGPLSQILLMKDANFPWLVLVPQRPGLRDFHDLEPADLALASREISRTDYADLLGTGVVITGGTALMDGIAELGERAFGLPVKVGTPRRIGGLEERVSDPRFAASVGLALHGLNGGRRARRNGKGRRKAFGRLKHWAEAFFVLM